MTLWGTSVARREDERCLTGAATFVADLDLDDAAWVTYVTSPVAHGVLSSVEVDEARAVPGVLGVFTAADIDLGPLPAVMPAFPESMTRSPLASDRVRYVGEPVAVVVSESQAAGTDAAELVVVEVDPLPAVTDPSAAATGEVLLFEGAADNVALHQQGDRPRPDTFDAEVVVTATLSNNRVAPCPLETRAAAALWRDGRLVHWSSCQGVHPVRDLLVQVYGLEPEQVRVVVPDVGGSFGAKARPTPEELLLGWLARAVGRPVRWLPTRSEDMVGLGHSRAQIQEITLAGDRDGTMRSAHIRILGDSGAYPFVGAFLPRNTGLLFPGCYRMEQVTWEADAVVTNTTPTTAYRGAGRPEAAAAIERAVDMFAARIGMDPVEVRRRNLLAPEEFPHQTPTGLTYDSGDYRQALDRALALVGYEDLRAEQSRRREADDERLLGIGVATFLDRTAGVPGSEYGAIELLRDGGVLVRTGSSPYGQGHHTSWAMLVSDRLGIPLDRIEVVHGDTDVVPRGGITGGSRSVQKAGSALAVAADELVLRGREVAATLLEAAVDDVTLDTGSGSFHVVGTPARRLSWSDIAAETADDPLSCEADYSGDASFPSGAYVAVVEVDRSTGRVELQRMVTVDDAGSILNPMLALGQVHGGVAQGIGQALFEEVAYDEHGNPQTANFADYGFPSAAELPSFDASLVETPTPNNILGAKGIGESGTIGAPPAVQNAVVDAVSHLGITHIDMPLTPQRVWQAIQAAGR